MTQNNYKRILQELDNCKRPLYFFHDDADGLCSFLQLYRYKREGKGVCVKARPRLDERFYKVVKEYQPDKIFVLDIAMIEQDFVDEFRKTPIIWIDHHDITETKGTIYFNPAQQNPKDHTCVSEICWEVTEQDLWIAAAGIIGDWQLNSTTKKFARDYPSYLDPKIDRPEVALFDSGYSQMIKIMNFILKGPTQEVNKCVKIFTRIESPSELLNEETPRARFIMKRFKKIHQLYQELLDFAVQQASRKKILLAKYQGNKMSFTGELANELLYRFPNKVILVGREKSGELKCSLRSGPRINIAKALEKALKGVNGYGGGHEQACGVCVQVEDFDKFLEQLEAAI